MSPSVPRPPKSGESLGDLRPRLVGEWDPERNGEVTPSDVKVSAAYWAWWMCSVPECGHRWDAPVYSRSRGAGCPECKKRTISQQRSRPKPGKSLGDLYLRVAEDWIPALNGGLTPFEVAPHAGLDANWRCIECKHEWAISVGNRTRNDGDGSGCPQCWARRHSKHMSRVVAPELSVAGRAPGVAAEWDWDAPENEGETPETVMAMSRTLRGWKCAEGHRWTTNPDSRIGRGSTCSDCKKGRESRQEVGMREFLAGRMVVCAKGRVVRTDGVGKRAWRVDVLCPDLGVVVEFDGSWWHSEKANPGMAVRDAAKADDLRSQGLRVVRVREAPLVALHVDDLVVPLGATGDVIGGLVWAHLVGLGVVAGVAA